MRIGSFPTSIMLTVAALVLTGCGDETTEGFKKGGPPAPAECVKRYNEDREATALGQHAYSVGHDSRAAHVFRLTDRKNGLEESCAVIFAASESDREYGILGGVEYTSGWDYTTRLRVTPQKRVEIQRLGAEQANVALESDGRIAPFR